MVSSKPAFPILNTGDPIISGLIAAHPLIDGIGTTISDLSGNGYSGTAIGGITWFNDPTLGVVLQLDGTTAYVSLNATINTVVNAQSTGTVAFWLKLANATPATTAKAGLIDLQTYNAASSATLYPDTDGLGYFGTFRQISRFNGVALGGTNRSAWHHLAVTTVSSGTYRVYVDGLEVDNTPAEFGVHASISPPTIGRSSDSGGNYFLDGYLGDFRVWGRELSAPEITTLINDPWRMYTPAGLAETAFNVVAATIDLRSEADTAMHSLSLVSDVRRQPDTLTTSLLSIVDLSPVGETAGTFLGVQIDVSPTPPTSFPALVDERDPRRKPDTPVKFASPFDTDMVLAIPFTEGTGTTAADFAGSAGGPHGATLIGTATWAAGGFRANDWTQALGLSPVSDYANIARDVELEPATDISIAAWVTPSSTQTSRAIIAKLGTAGFSYYLGTEIDQWRFQIQDNIDGVRTLDQSGTFTAGALVHLAVTYDGIIMRLFIDGVENNNIGNGGSIVYDIAKDVRVGQGEGGSSFLGVIDDVRVWNNRILSATEVADLYNSQFGMYCNYAIAISTAASVDVRVEGDTAMKSLSCAVDLRLRPDTAMTSLALSIDLSPMADTAATFLAAQIDVRPPTSNLAGLTIYSISPTSGNFSGGTPVVIKGNRLENITDVQLGGVSLTGIANPDPATITGTTGPRTPGLVDVVVFSSSLGNVTLIVAYSYVPFFGTGSDLLIKGVQLDPSIVRTEYFTGESGPLASNTTLSFVLADYPIDVTALELYVRRVGENGGTLQRQGTIYQYAVDISNRQIVWRDTATFALIPTDEIIVRYLAQGAI